MKSRQLTVICFILNQLCVAATHAQDLPVNFHHLTVKNGLNDPLVNAMCQDKYGYMWFASLGALNRFNGTSIRRFTNIPGDTTSPFSHIPYAMTCDQKGRLWIGYYPGMLEYDYQHSRFKRVHAFDGINIATMVPDNMGNILLSTSTGLIYYNPGADRFEEKAKPGDSLSYRLMNHSRVYDMNFTRGKFYIGTVDGIIVYDATTRTAQLIRVPELGGAANKVLTDPDNNIWISNYKNYRLVKVEAKTGQRIILDSLLLTKPGTPLVTAVDFRADAENTWIITNLKGLIQYNNLKKKATYHQHNYQLPHSISRGNLRSMYMSPDGTIWINTALGVDYFHPGKNFFQTVFPLEGEKDFNYGRGMTEDVSGFMWFATVDGITRYDPLRGGYRNWRNEAGKPRAIYFNSVRGIVDDAEGNIWIATGQGVNRYHPATGKMYFLDWKDSLPPSFYFSANRDSRGRIWLGTRDFDGFYYYDPGSKKIVGIGSHPVLNEFRGKGGRIVFEDRGRRLWFGFNGNGLLMYDPLSNQTRYWYNNERKADSTIAGNFVIDIKEDRNGVVWVSTFGGLTGIDIDKNRYYQFHERNGLTSNNLGPLAVDSLNRLWIGSANGLLLLDSSRRHFSYFTEEDGLPSLNFTEHSGYYTRNGEIMLPTTNGFIRFNPLQIQPGKESFNFFIAGIRIFDRLLSRNYNEGDVDELKLRHDENFFTIEFEALNYLNPGKIWWAYQLDGFDKDWRYTQDPKAVYTNVPGGEYTLRYKASADFNNWNVKEKSLTIRVGTVFYKSWWFLLLMVLLVTSVLYLFYRLRLHNQAKLHHMQSRAQLLEKEKTLVMYESLKQQLNPHFLFNSLTSLSGLIETDQKMAGNFLDQMSKIYRYILKNRDSELVSLKEEIAFVQIYINLQKTRFKNGLQVNFRVSEEEEHLKIAPVTLQNLIENAIKHNIIDADTPLQIDIFTEEGWLVVRNNLQRKNVVETSNRQGLQNLESLYHYLSGKPMVIEEDENYFTIRLPLI